jgi:hypothetical protein
MGGLFGGKPKVKKPKPVIVKPKKVENKAEKTRQKEDEERRRRRAGLASNILVQSGSGPADGPTIQKKKLLGE